MGFLEACVKILLHEHGRQLALMLGAEI